MELRHVHYRGRLLLYQARVPILMTTACPIYCWARSSGIRDWRMTSRPAVRVPTPQQLKLPTR